MPAQYSPLSKVFIARLEKSYSYTRKFRHYLLVRKLTVQTDHHNLTLLVNFRHPEGQIARLLDELSQYDMVKACQCGSTFLGYGSAL